MYLYCKVSRKTLLIASVLVSRPSQHRKVWQDLTIPAMVRATCAVTYASGARGGNIFLTKYSTSRQHMLIKWADIQAKQHDNGEKCFLLRIRKEKKAKRHEDSFQPVVLARGNPGEICPVEALAIAANESSTIDPNDAIFGSVTQTAVSWWGTPCC